MSKKHLVFFHQNYPAQFGPISAFLLQNYDMDITFFSEYASKPVLPGIRHILYKRDDLHLHDPLYFFTRYFEQECRSAYGAYKAFAAVKPRDPDVLIGHVGFGNLTLLHAACPEIPTVGFFEIFYNPYSPQSHESKYPVPKENILRIPIRNAMQLIELEYCTRGYSPTSYQRSTYPTAYQHKLETIFDGIDTHLYSPGAPRPDTDLPITWPKDAKVITYVARGLEAIRGFDIFMEVAHKISQLRPDVHFVIAGNPHTHYGSEMITVKEKTFKDYVMKLFPYDLSRYHFLNWVSEPALVDLFRMSDCHFYWTKPFTLSWSFFQSLSSQVIAVASDTAPVRDLIIDGETGFLIPPHDVDAFVDKMLWVLDHPQECQPLRENARQRMLDNYSLDVCLPRLADFYLTATPPDPIPNQAPHVLLYPEHYQSTSLV